MKNILRRVNPSNFPSHTLILVNLNNLVTLGSEGQNNHTNLIMAIKVHSVGASHDHYCGATFVSEGSELCLSTNGHCIQNTTAAKKIHPFASV